MCGLDLNYTLQILRIQSDDQFAPKDRRVQQLIRQFLSDNNQRFRPPSKLDARRNAAFIRAALKRDATSDTHKDTSASESYGLGHSSNDPFPPDAVLDLDNTPAPTESNPVPKIETCRPRSSSTLEDEIGPSTTYVCEDPEQLSFGNITPSDPTDESLDNDGSEISLKSQRSKIRQVLRQTSFSSSVMSDLISLMNKRWSISTFTPSDRGSVSAASIVETGRTIRGEQVAQVIRLRQRMIEQANTALIQTCCSNDSACIRQFVDGLITRRYDPFLTDPCSEVLHAELHQCLSEPMQPGLDPYGNSALFFAARSGAPAGVILPLIDTVADVNAVNADGQTFLFFLDPRGFQHRPWTLTKQQIKTLVSRRHTGIYDLNGIY
ncbi:hypothetical protein P153DRAFT_382714 [Dothidotthia symphoricarpi CBS 119687]|uniref:Uncharacterized protein n=1 Tax=Dothidotthia symphoricarpi CBS 119687 TaxID=1392245 RepID=A0A6A6AJ45_9PLEO|nr:uncharacterized protein P153DRAFT_382714 [Dothidotthia symphoricarpi CBS 119687]KAF2131820.1 hypothetical protein P153DRAFT_382714 [Dothidotthia symphoricarpi CBS 119687]